MNKINIIFMIPLLGGFGGTETYLFRVIQYIDKKKFNPIVIYFRDGNAAYQQGAVRKAIENLGILVHKLGFQKLYGLKALRGIFILKRLIKQNKINIIQTFHQDADIYGAVVGKLFKVPVVISSKRDLGFDRSKKLNFIQNYFTNRFIDNFIAPSNAVRRNIQLNEKIYNANIDVIYNGININDFKPQPENPELLKEFRIRDGELCIASFSNFFPIKGVEYFINAMPLILKTNANVKFILVGDGVLHEELEKKVRDLNIEQHVFFAGRRKDVHLIYSIADLSVNTSLSEGFSNSIIESLASGVPVVAANVGGNPEAITDGKTGFLFNSGDSNDLANKIIKIISDRNLLEQMKRNARIVAEENYNINNMINKIEHHYFSFFNVN